MLCILRGGSVVECHPSGMRSPGVVHFEEGGSAVRDRATPYRGSIIWCFTLRLSSVHGYIFIIGSHH